MITTIIVPTHLLVSYIPDSSPIWQDSSNNLYYVASGVLEDYPKHLVAEPRLVDNTIQIIENSEGLSTLLAIGLSPSL